MGNDNLEKEITDVIAADEIISAVLQEREPETQNLSWAEKYKDFDFVGAAGNKVKGLIEKGKQKAKEFWTKKVKTTMNAAIYKSGVAVETIPQIPNKIKEGIKNADQKILEAQLAHARDKFEKRKKRQTFTSKAEDLKNVIMHKIKSWRNDKKEDFAIMLETTKVYTKLVKDKAVEEYEHIGTQVALGTSAVKKVGRKIKENAKGKYTQVKEDFVEGVKTGVEKAKSIKDDVSFYAEYGAYNAGVMAGKAKDGMVNATVAFGGAAIAAPGIAIKGVKKGARGVALFGAKGLRNTLNKAADLAVKGAKALDEKINTPEKEIQNKDDDAR